MEFTLYELSTYNNSAAIAKTFNLSDGETGADIKESINNWLSECSKQTGQLCEEWTLADYEELPEIFFGKYDIDFYGLELYLSLESEENREIYIYLMSNYYPDDSRAAFDAIDDVILYHEKNDTDLAVAITEEIYNVDELPDFIRYAIDYKQVFESFDHIELITDGLYGDFSNVA